MRHYVVTAILRDFSSDNNDNKWEISGDEVPGQFLTFLFYANGNCKDNEGYVSIILSYPQDWGNSLVEFFYYDDIRFHVYLVDVAGNKRFTQSFVVKPDEVNDSTDVFQFGLERYLKRETLLNDPAELLPDDCLTICVNVDRCSYSVREVVTFADPDGPHPICLDETGIYISLDGDFGRQLCRVSEVFRRAADAPMMESKTRKVRIREGEDTSFMQICCICSNESQVLPVSAKDICDLYRVADKYDIQPVIETCRQFVNALLLTTDDPKVREQAAESVPAILELAEDYRDEDLKETVQTYLDSKENFGTNYDALGKHLKAILHTEWTCKFRTASSDLSLTMRRRNIEPEFKFYQ